METAARSSPLPSSYTLFYNIVFSYQFPKMGHVKRLLPFLVALSLIHPASEIPPVYLDYFEQFGGDAAVSRGLRLLGYYGATFDLRICSFHDFLVPAGFLATLRACMRLRRRGLAWFAPPCSTWVWIARNHTKRSAEQVLIEILVIVEH